MSTFCIVVTTPPHQNQSATVIELIKAIYEQGHNLNGVFLYQDAVLAANTLTNMPSDEFNFIESLKTESKTLGFAIHLCITAAEKRGLTDQSPSNIDPAFTISGLGEMVELSNGADRVIQL